MASITTFDELHALASEMYEKTRLLPKEKRKKEITDEIEELLLLACVFGYERVRNIVPEGFAELLSEPSAESLVSTIYEPVAGQNFKERIASHIEEQTLSEEDLRKIIETDFHRCEETTAFETAKRAEEITGLQAFKVWETMQDEKVRDTHWYIEGVEVPLDGRFYTFDNDSARFPGDFTYAENNVNCRCRLGYRFR